MKFLVPFDASADALAAVRHVIALKLAGLPLTCVLVNVQPPPSLYEVVTAHDSDRLSDLRREAGADLLAPAEGMLQGAGIEWESEVAGGAAPNLIVELAENYGCNAICMGLGDGAVSHPVSVHSAVPVTLVRALDDGAA